MLTKAIEIARLHLFTTFRYRATFVFGFVLPLIATYILGLATTSFGDDAPPTWRLMLVNQDNGVLGAALVERLNGDSALAVEETNLDEAVRLVEENEVSAALIVPALFSDALSNENRLDLELRVNPENSNTGILLEQTVAAHGMEIAGILNASHASEQIADNLELFDGDANDSLRTSYQTNAQSLAEIGWQSPPITVKRQQFTRNESQRDEIPSGLNQTAPAQLVIFAMFFYDGRHRLTGARARRRNIATAGHHADE